ncbi:MAG: M14 family metallopeptidase [Anaerolineales bacterium]
MNAYSELVDGTRLTARIGILMGWLGLWLAACSGGSALESSVRAALPLRLPPAWTPTPTRQPAPTRTPSPTPEPSPTPLSSGLELIGTSVAGRPLEVYRFGHGPIRRLIVAGIHGGYEWNTIDLAYELIELLDDRPELVPRRISLYVLPALNPDGAARSHGRPGRANENGVDLNRNWPSNWQADWPREGCWNYLPISGGSGPASEPEVEALMSFILAKRFDAIISYHSAALGIFPGGQLPLADSVRLAEAVAAVSPYPYPPIDSGCLFTGQFADWAADRGIAAIDLELETHHSTDFEINQRVLEVFLNWRR